MKSREEVHIETLTVEDDGTIPNHPGFPVLVYEQTVTGSDDVKELFNTNNWLGAWKGSVFEYHHYHSNSHEVLGCVSGSALLHIGGEQGRQLNVKNGDILVLPAGYGHKLIEQSEDFAVIGAYPGGSNYDMCTGDPSERPEKVNNIYRVPLPDYDPVFGSDGPLFTYWTNFS
ncbi:Uncharacterized protein YjlB [Marinococcus luteus]|uniref:Uncharacterized protein YjlB n=1 Tax=Marinococcus luteus TaxID=1122204 RepID=A0A1H2X4Z0_9BACI|nr:cupin domain-containing protein [Marinococcus luteus]SDW87950.1 Uncharacterized protein YjlB [Marinococcus luteus]